MIEAPSLTDPVPASTWRRDLLVVLLRILPVVLLLIGLLSVTGLISFGADPMAGT